MSKYLIAILLLLSVSFAWTGYDVPSCLDTHTVLGVNFTYGTQDAAYACSADSRIFFGKITVTSDMNYTTHNSTHFKVFTDNDLSTLSNYSIATTGNYTIYGHSTHATTYPAFIYCQNGSGGGYNVAKFTTDAVDEANMTDYNSTHYFFESNEGVSGYCLKTHLITLSVNSNAGQTNIIFPYYNVSSFVEFTGIVATKTKIVPFDYISAFYSSSSVLRSDFTTGTYTYLSNADAYYEALLYYGGQLVLPKITYIPSLNAFADFYNTTNNVAYLLNNTVQYVYDKTTAQWYVVPAYSAANYDDAYAISVLFYNAGEQEFDLPVLPTYLNCRQDGNNYNISSGYSSTVTHTVYYWNSTALNSTSSTSSSFSFNINTTTYPFVNYTVNGNMQCNRNEDATLFGISQIGMPEETYEPLLTIIWIGSLGLAVAVPFAVIFPIVLNDLFGLVALSYMALIVVFAGVLSVLIRGGKLSVKGALIYLFFAFILFMQMFIVADTEAGGDFATQYPAYNATFSAYNSSLEGIGTLLDNPEEANLASFVVGAPAFLISIFELILTLPLIISNTLLIPLQAISPALYTAVSLFTTTFLYLAYMWIFLKAYEIIANRYKSL